MMRQVIPVLVVSIGCFIHGTRYYIQTLLLSHFTKVTVSPVYGIHCKKVIVFPSPARMSLTKVSLAWNNLSFPGQGEYLCLVTPQLGRGKAITFFYSVVLHDYQLLSACCLPSLENKRKIFYIIGSISAFILFLVNHKLCLIFSCISSA